MVQLSRLYTTTGKDPDAEKDWSQEEKRMTEDEMVGWYHRLSGHESEQSPGVGDGQGVQMCCKPWGCKEWDRTEQQSWTELMPQSKVNGDQTVDVQEVRLWPSWVPPFFWLLYCVPWCRRRWAGGHDCRLTCELAVGSWRFFTCSGPWDKTSVHCSHSGSHFQGHVALREQGVDKTTAAQRQASI